MTQLGSNGACCTVHNGVVLSITVWYVLTMYYYVVLGIVLFMLCLWHLMGVGCMLAPIYDE